MSKPVVSLNDEVIIKRPQADTFGLFADPTALMQALDIEGPTARKLGNAQRWIMAYPEKLGDRVIDLGVSDMNPPEVVVWLASLRGFQIETEIRFAADGTDATTVRLASKVRAESLRAKLMAPILKLGQSRLKRGLRKGLKQIAKKLS